MNHPQHGDGSSSASSTEQPRPPSGDRMQGLLAAVAVIAEDPSLEAVLRHVVQAACTLVDAGYGALGVIGENGGLSHFITEGLEPDAAKLIGHLPTGHGVLGLLISDPRPLRLPNIRDHPASYGFPKNHPAMRTFLGVPIRIRDSVFGNLYLTERHGGGLFTLDDEELAIALAVAAGFAIENAKLFDDAQLRSRWLEAGRTIAVRMMGPKSDDEEDNRNWVAQTALKASESAVALIVGQPNEAGQVEVLAAAGTDASTWVRQLLDLNGEGISGVLKSGRPLAYEEASLLLGPATRGLSGPALLARLGTHAAGQGMIVLIRANGEPVFSALATDMVAVYCTQSALALELAKTHRIREQLVLFADRDRIAQDLHDVVIQRLFAAGLNIQGLARFVDESAGLARIRAITDELDTTIKELRDTIYSLRASATDADLLSSRILNTISKISRSLPYAPRIILSGPIDSKVTVELGEQVLAVVTEGVSNAVRHAQADEIDVAVSVDGQSVNVSVSDDGCGVGVLQGTSGLANMEVRALTFNGTFQLDSNGARGTRFLWSVPMDGKQPADGQDGKLAPMPANATVDPTSG